MSSGRGSRIPEYWYGQVPVPPFMRFMEVIYAGAVSLRRLAYRRGWRRRYGVAVPVVVIGNLVAGGTGKTPLTIEIVARLREAGWTRASPAVVMVAVILRLPAGFNQIRQLNWLAMNQQ